MRVIFWFVVEIFSHCEDELAKSNSLLNSQTLEVTELQVVDHRIFEGQYNSESKFADFVRNGTWKYPDNKVGKSEIPTIALTILIVIADCEGSIRN